MHSTVKLIYIKGGGQKPTHNYVMSCNNINDLSRFVVQIYQRYGPLLAPLICKPANFFREAPSFLHLHAERLITSLDTICPSPVQLGPNLAHNLRMLHPSERLIEQLDRIAPFEAQMVKVVNALVKEAGSRKKRNIGEAEDVEQDERP